MSYKPLVHHLVGLSVVAVLGCSVFTIPPSFAAGETQTPVEAAKKDPLKAAKNIMNNQAEQPILVCHIASPEKVKLGQPIPLSFTLHNISANGVKILQWNTPVEGWFNDYLSVTRGGQSQPYQGPMVKRRRPSEDDYFQLKPGEMKTVTVDLAMGYQVDSVGLYEITYTGRLNDLQFTDTDKAIKDAAYYPLHCNEIKLVVE